MMTMTKSDGPVENESVCIRILNVYLVDLSLIIIIIIIIIY